MYQSYKRGNLVAHLCLHVKADNNDRKTLQAMKTEWLSFEIFGAYGATGRQDLTFQRTIRGQRRTVWKVRDGFQKVSIGPIKASTVTVTVSQSVQMVWTATERAEPPHIYVAKITLQSAKFKYTTKLAPNKRSNIITCRLFYLF